MLLSQMTCKDIVIEFAGEPLSVDLLEMRNNLPMPFCLCIQFIFLLMSLLCFLFEGDKTQPPLVSYSTPTPVVGLFTQEIILKCLFSGK